METNELLEGLTSPQREAVLHVEGPLLVLAGAGSGKTRVITRRVAHIAEQTGRADQILAITFTNKAAEEMRQRIFDLGVGPGAWVCTFHALCARLLRQHGHLVGLQPNFTIFDDDDHRTQLKEAIEACGLSAENWSPRSVESAIGDAKNRLLSAEEYAAEARDFQGKTIARIYAEYERRLMAQNACDFDDLLMHVACVLRDQADVRGALSDRFRYLLIDEYQDTNHAQYSIAASLAGARRNLCATGDPDQSIYAWRGADIRNILEFEEQYPDARVIRLEENFRSTPAILAAASRLIGENKRRKRKELWTHNEDGPPVRIWECEDERHEAELIAREIAEHLQEGGVGADIAIFYRVNALSRALEDELRRRQLPYQIARGVEFYSRKEVKDVLAYLRVIHNRLDETALLRAINTPARGIGKTTIERLRRFATEVGISLDNAVSRPEEVAGLKAAEGKLRGFAWMIAKLRAMPARPVRAIVEAVLKESGMEAALKEGEEGSEDRLENVEELVTAARQFDQENPEGGLGDWLQQISLSSDVDAVELSGGPVTLMTLHAAKGLEYPIVYMVGLEDGLLPHRRTVMENEEDIEEERRLCFVGMTRAKHRLTMSRARYRMVRGITERRSPSRFVRELPEEQVERESFAAERDRSRAHLGRRDEMEDSQDWSEFRPGQRVRHEEYGDGFVLRMEPRGRSVYVRVLFDEAGERSFALEHAELTVLEC